MADRLKPDICVIGASAGGRSVAAAAAAFGVSVVLVEQGMIGGESLSVDSVPLKSLIAAARHAHVVMQAKVFGIDATATVDFTRVQAHVHRIIAGIAPNESKERLGGLGVQVIAAQGRFRDKRTVVAGDHEIRARRYVIATGSSPALPAISGLADIPYLTHETVFDLTVCPQHLIVMGASVIGLEFAQAFRRLGAAVTVLEAGEMLAREDPECLAIVLDQLVREGIALRHGATVARVSGTVSRIEVVLAGEGGEETIAGSHLLMAAARRPNVDELGLEAAGIEVGPQGIAVNHGLRTTNRRVYAIGDAVGGPSLQAASYHAELVVRNALFRQRDRVNESTVPRVVFTEPEFAHAGLTEVEARKHGAIRILRWPYHDNDRAQAERATAGHIKIVTDAKGRILGTTIVGAVASELIAIWALAVGQRLNIRELAGMAWPYPTFGEVGKRAAITYFNPSLTSPWVRRIIGWVRRVG